MILSDVQHIKFVCFWVTRPVINFCLPKFPLRLKSEVILHNPKMPLNTKSVYPAEDPKFVHFASRRSVVHSTKGIVSSTQPLASNCGLRILQQGGNCAVSILHMFGG